MRKKLLYILLALLLGGGFFAYKAYTSIFSPNVELASEKLSLYIPSDASYKVLLDSLKQRDVLVDTTTFKWVSKLMKFKNVKSGKYSIQNGWSNKELVGMFRSGNQTPIKLTFNNARTIDDLAGIIAQYVEADSTTLQNLFTDQKTLESTGLNKENILSLFIPNTYEVLWNTKPEKLLSRFKNEHEKFWTDTRKQQAQNLELTPEEVYTLASIVQKESNLKSEKPTIAGVYLNRLKRNILLQADPTVVFASGQFDLRRVLNKHLAIDSPYNTYKYEGLPPGPIYMPDIESIDAVLSPEQHNYLYFCASIEKIGKHEFAATLSQHNRNANKYRNWLNQQRIYK